MSGPDRGEATRAKLIRATLETVSEHGVGTVSARTVAATAGVNQALVFYHFGSVSALLSQACLASAAEHVALWSSRLRAVASFSDLVAVARELHAEDRSGGHVRILAQVLAAAQSDPELAEATGRAMGLWTAEVEHVLDRLLAGSPLADVVAAGALTHVVSAAFVGLELIPAPEAMTDQTDDALARLEALAALLDGLGPVGSRLARASLRRRA